MGRYIALILAVSGALFVLPSLAAASGKRIALVVTNASYTDGIAKLESPHRDGDSLTAALEAVGFQVQHVRDASREAFKTAIQTFVERFETAGDDAISFFYYSGHGAADREFVGENFMIPVGTGLSGVGDLAKRAVALRDVIEGLKANRPKSARSFIVLDACRDVAFANPGGALTSGMIRMDRVTSMLISYATAEGQVALDQNFFSSSLASMLPDPELEAARVFKKVKERVFQLSGEKQEPWYEDGLIGDFYLARTAATAKPAVAIVTPRPDAPKPPEKIDVPQQTVPDRPAPVLPAPVTTPAGAILRPGQAIVTRFSGTKSFGGGLDPQGPVVAVADVSRLGTASAGTAGQKQLTVTAAEIGQVYGSAVDPGSEFATGRPRAPDLYLAATSAYGLSIAPTDRDGNKPDKGFAIVPPDRGGNPPDKPLDRGKRGVAWAPGQFGAGKGGGAGAIYKVDGATGAVSLFTEIALDGVKNSGPGLGQLVYDPRTRQLFASDLDTGMIHRVSIKGAELGFYDHGVDGRLNERLEAVNDDPKERADPSSTNFRSSDPASWGFTNEARRVWGLALQGDRLFYGVGEGPQVWSVGIRIDGTFGKDARREIDVYGAPTGSQIAKIDFDAQGNMYVAVLAGMTVIDVSADAGDGTRRPTQSAILRYRPQADQSANGRRWQDEPDDLTEGAAGADRVPGGALAIGYGFDAQGKIDLASCGASLWVAAVAGTSDGGAGKPVIVGWSGAALPRGGEPAHIVDLGGPATGLPPGGLTMVAPCSAPQHVGGIMTVAGRPPTLLPPAQTTPQTSPIEQAALRPPTQKPVTAREPDEGRPGREDRVAIPDANNGQPQGNIPPPPCMSLVGARFQCVGQSWELDVNLGDLAGKGLDALKVSSLSPNSTVEPGLQRRSTPTDPFRIRFDKVSSGTVVPIDVCLFDEAASRSGKRYRCCRAQLRVELPTVSCGQMAATTPAITQTPTTQTPTTAPPKTAPPTAVPNTKP